MSLVYKEGCRLRIFNVFGLGFEGALAKFKVYVEGNLCEVMKNEETGIGNCIFDLPGKGLLRIVVLDKDEGFAGSVQIKIDALPSSGKIFLPLSQDELHDTINELQDFNGIPRISFQILRKKQSTALLNKEKLKKFKENYKKIQIDLQKTQDLLKTEKKNSEEIQKKLEETQKILQENLRKYEIRDYSMLNLLEKKDQELKNSFEVFHRLKSKYKSIKSQNKVLSDKLNSSQPQVSNEFIQGLQDELSFFKEKVEILQKNELKLENQISEIGKEWLESTKCASISQGPDKENCLNTEKFLGIQLKAALLEMDEKQSALRQKIQLLQNEKQTLNSRIFEIETLGKPYSPSPLVKILCESNKN